MNHSLLSTCPKCGNDLDAARSSQTSGDLRFCPQCNFPVLLVAGKYQLDSILGRGGFGTVFLSHHVRLQRESERVVKIISPDVFEIPGMHERFEREVQLTSLLSQRDEHIVRIYDDFGEIPGLGHFYVMEYLQGTPLDAYFKPGEELPPLDFCFHIFRQLCQAMYNAHTEGVLHRDLKPENLFVVSRKQDSQFLKILDFGIARPMNQEDLTKTGLTQGALGTPFYMSPEQCLNEPVDARTDIYSMGVILYKMLTGMTPFEGDGVQQSNSVVRVLMRMMQDEARPPSELRPDRVGGALEALVMKALAKRPDDRFQTALEMKQAFDATVGGASTQHSCSGPFEATLPNAQPSPIANRTSTGNSSRSSRSSSRNKRAERKKTPTPTRRSPRRNNRDDDFTQQETFVAESKPGKSRGLLVFVVLLFVLGGGVGTLYALGFDKLVMSILNDESDADVDAGDSPIRVVKRDAGTAIRPVKVINKLPDARPTKLVVKGPDQKPKDAGKRKLTNIKQGLKTTKNGKQGNPTRKKPPVVKTRCPATRRLQCFPGWVSFREKYRFKRKLCWRWNCRRRKFKVSCPPLRRYRCHTGYSSIKEYYHYRGLRCLRWGCKRNAVRCPYSRKIYCLGSQAVRKAYYFRGQRCYKWVCAD